MVLSEWWLIGIAFGIVLFLILLFSFFFLKYRRGYGYFLSKFSAFTRIRFRQLEERRQTFCPSDDGCQCQTRQSSAHIEPNPECPHRAPTLYMSFAGAAMIVGGVQTTEWRGSLKQLHKQDDDQFDVLFLTDPAQCFYLQDPEYQWQGLTYYRRLVETYSKLYQRVVLIGASLGGSMVCMCADLATISIAFNPILDPILLGLPWRLMGAYCSARQARVIRDQVRTTIEKITHHQIDHPCALHIHWSQRSAPDQRQARPFVQEKKVSVTSVMDFDLQQPFLQSTMGVHIWFHPSARHALARRLKRRRELIPLLRSHLGMTAEEESIVVSEELGLMSV